MSKKRKIIKKKIALFTPLPPQKSGISDYSNELIPFLSKYFDLDIFIDQDEINSTYVEANFNIYNHEEYEILKKNYQNTIIQFGNSNFHNYMIDYIDENSYVVLHDFFIGDMIQSLTTSKGSEYFVDNLLQSHKEGQDYLDRFSNGLISLENIINELPINKKLLENAKGIIVHSEYTKKLFNHFYPNDTFNVTTINQVVKSPSKKFLADINKDIYKHRLKLKSNQVLITAFGHISESKQYDFILKSMIDNNIFKENILLIFVGDFVNLEYKKYIHSIIDQNQISKYVRITGYVDTNTYMDYVHASDIGINLRKDSRGETSRSLLVNMGFGLPTIVNNYATFAEFPINSVSMAQLNNSKDFTQRLKELLTNKSLREDIANKAFQYIQENHNPTKIAENYYDFIKDIPTNSLNIYEEVAELICNNGLENMDEEEYIKIATSIKNNTIT